MVSPLFSVSLESLQRQSSPVRVRSILGRNIKDSIRIWLPIRCTLEIPVRRVSPVIVLSLTIWMATAREMNIYRLPTSFTILRFSSYSESGLPNIRKRLSVFSRKKQLQLQKDALGMLID